jgi:dihydroorotate dehydrogenase electron transfer subunit
MICISGMHLLMEKPVRVSKGHCLLRIKTAVEQSLPGQFINIRVSKQNDPLLRRPFSIFSHEGGVITTVVKVVGKGTSMLAESEPGEIDLLGPLGNGFTIMKKSRVLIAGGGVGNTPLYFLARALAETRCEITFLYGSRSREFIYLADLFRETAKRFVITTDDGSEGHKGPVTDFAASLLEKERFDMIYTCGPAAMMKGMVSLAANTPIEVSVENYFGCGIGLCFGCAVETSGGMKRACLDGPVFSGAAINWDTMPD